MFKKVVKIPLQYKIMILTISMVCLVLSMVGAILIHNIYQQIKEEVGQKAINIGRIIAEVPTVQEAIVSDNPSVVIQPIAELWRVSTGAAFIVVSNMDQIRLSHPIVENIGTPLSNLYRAPVLHGQEYVAIDAGSLESSLRANVPIFELNGTKQIGFVSVGFYVNDLNEQIIKGTTTILYVLTIALILSSIGSILVARNVKKAIYGLEPYEIAMILREKEATLDSIREGVIAVDLHGNIRLVNNEATAIIGQQAKEMCGQSIDIFLESLHWDEVMKTGKPIYDQEKRVHDIIILTNMVPIIVEGDVVGAVITFRDRTEISLLAEEMTGIHRFVDVMRAQTHEFKNKLHVISGLIQLGSYDQAVDLIVENYASEQGGFEKLSSCIKDTVTFGLLVGKKSRAKELGIEFIIGEETSMTKLPGQLTSGDMVMILGNLIENAFEAVAGASTKKIIITMIETAGITKITVKNSGAWIDDKLGERIYQRGFSSKGEKRGYGLTMVAEKVKVNNGKISYCNLPEGGVSFEIIMPNNNKGDEDGEN